MKNIITALVFMIAGSQVSLAFQNSYFVEKDTLSHNADQFELQTITDTIHYRNGKVEYRIGHTKHFPKSRYQVEVIQSDVKAVGNMNISEQIGYIVQVTKIPDQLSE